MGRLQTRGEERANRAGFKRAQCLTRKTEIEMNKIPQEVI